MPDQNEDGALKQRIAQACSDPGAILPRGDNYEEPLHHWQARAVEEVIADDLAAAHARMEGSEAYAQGKRDGYAAHAHTFGPLVERGYEWKRQRDALEAIAAIEPFSGTSHLDVTDWSAALDKAQGIARMALDAAEQAPPSDSRPEGGTDV